MLGGKVRGVAEDEEPPTGAAAISAPPPVLWRVFRDLRPYPSVKAVSDAYIAS